MIALTAPSHVRFEHRDAGEPALGLGLSEPRLSWRLAAAPEGYRQSGFEVEVTRTPWGGQPSVTTHVVESSEQVLVPWPAAPLAAREQVGVRVRVRDEDEWSPWSEPAVAEAGLLAPADWTARWISPRDVGGLDSPAPAVIGSLDVPGDVVAARLYLSAHGWYEAHLNGTRVGADWFGPGWTAYHSRIRWYAYDVSDLVSGGSNELQIALGNGWFRGRLAWGNQRAHYGDRLAALAQLEVVTADGSTHVLGTDGSWTAHETQIVFDDIYDGQTADLRRPPLGEAGPVDVLDETLDTLVPAEGPAVRVTDVLPAQRVWRSPAGKLLIDFGQNVVGVVRLRTHGLPAGHQVVVTQAEVLEHDELGTRPLRTARCTDTYILPGGDAELMPTFTFHGFRYAQVDGLDELDAADVEAVVLGSALTRTGWFSCSEPLVNRLHENVVWGMRGNFVDVPTDCPQRDERLGWTGDIQVFSPTALTLHDAVGFLSSWTRDVAADQHEDGLVPIVVPDVLHAQFAAAAWGDAATIVPWNIYLASGDAEVLARQLPSMRGWVDKVAGLAGEDHLWTGGFQFGDWLDPDAPPEDPAAAKAAPDVVATACLYRCADVLAQAYAVVGEDAPATQYRGLADAVRTAFVARYVTPDGLVISDAATVYAQAIVWGMLSPEQEQVAGERLAGLARLASFRVSTGFVGTPLITDALTRTGHTDVAYRLLQEQGCPSWLYPVTMGATTVWERWDSMLEDGTINPGEMTSFNHYALGAVADWMYRVVAGLAIAEPGGRRLRIAPQPGGTLTHATASWDSPYGRAEAGWERDGDEVRVRALVPVGATAEVVLPDGQQHDVGTGEHTWTLTLPQPPRSRPATIGDLIDDAELWPRVVAAVVARGPLTDARSLTGMLKAHLDAPVERFGAAATADGMMPGAEQLQADLDALLADQRLR